MLPSLDTHSFDLDKSIFGNGKGEMLFKNNFQLQLCSCPSTDSWLSVKTVKRQAFFPLLTFNNFHLKFRNKCCAIYLLCQHCCELQGTKRTEGRQKWTWNIFHENFYESRFNCYTIDKHIHPPTNLIYPTPCFSSSQWVNQNKLP